MHILTIIQHLLHTSKQLAINYGIYLILCIIILSSGTGIYAQQSNNYKGICLEAKLQLNDASKAIDLGNNEYALLKLFEIVNLGIQDSCPEILIDSYRMQALAFSNQNDIENSLISYLNAIAIAEKIKSEPTLVSLYILVGEIFFAKEVYPKSGEYFEMAYLLIKESDQLAEKLYLLENKALAYQSYNNTEKAIIAYEQIIELMENRLYSSIITRSYYQLSNIYRSQKMWDKAILYSKKLLKNMEEVKDTLGTILSLNNIGYYQVNSGDYSNAETTIIKALNISRSYPISPKVIAGLYTNLGICYQNQGVYPKAISNLNNAKVFINSEEYPSEMAILLNTLAWVYYRRGDLYNASQHSRQSIEWALKSDNAIVLADCYRTFSMLLRHGNDPIGALEYFEKYSVIRDSLALEQRISEQARDEILARLEKAEKEQRLFIADKEMQELMLKQLRLESESRRQEVELLRSQREVEQLEKDRTFQAFQLAKRENEAALQKSTIKNLEQANAIKEFQIKQNEADELQRQKEIALLQSEKDRQQLQIEKEMEIRKRAIWMLIISFLTLVIVIFGLVITRKKNLLLAEQKKVIEQKNTKLENANKDIIEKNIQLSELAEEVRAQNEEITTQKEMIEEKNKNITDSIQYASLIQTAVLPQELILSESFSDFFVLYKPRDIVSGDFWWYSKMNERVIVAVADCTGHGVPGAFLSMLGTTLLTEISSHSPNISANNLLNELQIKMVEALVHGNTNDPRRDGMDIAVCIFNSRTNLVEFAGANNPVYILRDNEIQVIKGDKAPIGLSLVENIFTLKTFQAKLGDRFFLFSDGYPDQFGGNSGRKLMYKKFREMLVESSNLNMTDQKEYLDNAFTQWQGYNEQVDDVLVLGVSV